MDSGPTLLAIVFLDFELLPGQRVLLRAGLPVAIGARAFDLLTLLATHPGEVVSHQALIAGVWPNSVVIDANLRVQIAALRKLLGVDGSAIVNVAGRGYCFTARVQHAPPAPEVQPAVPAGASAPRSASIVAGLVRCASKPAASARATSASWP